MDDTSSPTSEDPPPLFSSSKSNTSTGCFLQESLRHEAGKTSTTNSNGTGSPSEIKKKKKKNSETRRKQKAAARTRKRRGSIRSTPIDDISAFANSPNAVLRAEATYPKNKRVLILHGDPSKPNPILPGGKWDEDDFEAIEILKKALSKLDGYEFSFLCHHDSLLNDLQRIAKERTCDLVLQLCDEGYMNNPKMELHITALLEMVGIPYTGTGPVALGLTYDKQMVMDIAKTLDIPVPKSLFCNKDSEILDKMKNNGMEFPVFVKPNSTDGSYGITTKSICRNEEGLLAAIDMIRNDFHIIGPVLLQEYLEGTDLNTSIIGNPPGKHTFLSATEEDYSGVPADLPRILGFEAKWDENSPYYKIGTIKAKSVSPETIEFMNECSARLVQRLGIRDYSRVDWKLDKNGNPRFLEINPNCGWSYDAHLQRMCALDNKSYSDMFKMILEAAEQRLLGHAKKACKMQFVNVSAVSTVRMADKQVPPTIHGALNL